MKGANWVLLHSVQLLSHVRPFATPWTAAHQISLSITNSQSLLKFMFFDGDATQLSHPLSSPSPPAFILFPGIRVFSSESVLCIMWSKYWSFSFSVSPSNGHSGLISFRIDWFDFLVVQGILKSLLWDHSLKAPILWCSAIFMVQFLHLYMTTGKTIALTIETLVAKQCLCFLMCCLVLS